MIEVLITFGDRRLSVARQFSVSEKITDYFKRYIDKTASWISRSFVAAWTFNQFNQSMLAQCWAVVADGGPTLR